MKAIVLSDCCGANPLHALEGAGFSRYELSSSTLVPQTLGQMFALQDLDVSYELLDELVPDVSISDIDAATRRLAVNLFDTSTEIVDFPLRDAYFSSASASETVISCLASAAFDATFSETSFVACSASSTVARNMSHASRIARAAHREAGWRIIDIPCQRLWREREPSQHTFENTTHRRETARQFLHGRRPFRHSTFLVSSKYDALSQRTLLTRYGMRDVRFIQANYPTESTSWNGQFVEAAASLVDAFLFRNSRFREGTVETIGSTRLYISGAIYREALTDVVAHHLVLNQIGLVGNAALIKKVGSAKEILVGRGTPSRRVLIEFLAESGLKVRSVPHGVGEGFFPSSRAVDADIHYLPTVESLVRDPGQEFAPQYFDGQYLNLCKDTPLPPRRGVQLAMTDVPYGGSWPAWSWGVAEYGDALVALASLPPLTDSVRLRERPSDPNRIGQFLAHRRGVRISTSEAPPNESALLIGIGYRGSLLLEAAARGQACATVVGRLRSSRELDSLRYSSAIPSISVDQIQQMDERSRLDLSLVDAFWGENHPLKFKPL